MPTDYFAVDKEFAAFTMEDGQIANGGVAGLKKPTISLRVTTSLICMRCSEMKFAYMSG